jgi:hypothetical protein
MVLNHSARTINLSVTHSQSEYQLFALSVVIEASAPSDRRGERDVASNYLVCHYFLESGLWRSLE